MHGCYVTSLPLGLAIRSLELKYGISLKCCTQKLIKKARTLMVLYAKAIEATLICMLSLVYYKLRHK